MSSNGLIDWQKIEWGIVFCECGHRYEGKAQMAFEKGKKSPVRTTNRSCPICKSRQWFRFCQEDLE
jgi:hypothetical protein